MEDNKEISEIDNKVIDEIMQKVFHLEKDNYYNQKYSKKAIKEKITKIVERCVK